jgi:hypothetical protein
MGYAIGPWAGEYLRAVVNLRVPLGVVVQSQEPSISANILMQGLRRARFTRARVKNLILPRCSLLAGGGAVSTVIENLLLRKQKLVEQLEKAPSVEDRDKIEHQLEQINTALDFLDSSGSKGAR